MQDPLDHEVYGVMHEIDARKFSDDTPIDEMSGRRANVGIYSPMNWHCPDGGSRQDPQYQDHLRGDTTGWM
jgi:hypothetical protein